jgi:PAS domain S-box-containing protein
METLDRQLEILRTGAHVCPIYTSPAERLRVLVAFFRGALLHGGQCLYIADPERADELRRSLRELGAYAIDALDRGALIVVTTREPYVAQDGHFDPQSMLALHAAIAEQSRGAGYSELRIAGEMAWVLGEDIGTERFLEFEALLNEALPAGVSSGLCQYDRRRSQSPLIRDVLRTHPVAIVDLILHDNVFYEPLDVVLGNGDVDSARVDWMITRLQSLTRRDTAVVGVGRLALEDSLTDLMRAAPELVARELELDYVQVFELVPSGDAVRLAGTTGPYLDALGTVERLDRDSPFVSADLGAARPLFISDWQTESRFQMPTQLRDAGVTSSVSVVISMGVDARVYGMLSVHSREGRIFSDDEILFLETVGTFLAFAIAAARSASSFRALVENAPDVIVRFDGDLKVTYVNPAIERVLGTAAESLIGKATYRDLGILEPLAPAWELVLRQVWRTGREQSFELTIQAPLGERVFESRIVPELSPEGDVQSLLSIWRDITDQQRAEAERSELYRELVAQQDRVLELMGRLSEDRERTLERTAAASPLNLTEREREILRLLAAGRTNREIGAEIGLTTGTAKNQVAHLLSKLNVSDRTQAAVRAVQLGIIDMAD